MAYKDFTQLSVWQKGFDLLKGIYKLTKKIPKDERFGLISDMRRAANSVVHNLAEGFGRYEKRDKSRFHKISRGSAYEVISQTMVCEALDFFNDKEKKVLIQGYQNLINELDKLIKAVEAR